MSDISDAFKNMTPHRLTEKGMARMVVRHDIDPMTGACIGRSVDPRFVAALEQQGYDPEPFVQRLLDVEAEDEPR